ncbi:uncharacterized protein LOC134244121 isoform X2 [Saccostrea cucullata]|uniref:uncharacterized protein LOC134244121 isoform X2 n=1 Tax=Saccostrea cuccullata TaxID=36930 RepID=UPI002ED693D6
MECLITLIFITVFSVGHCMDCTGLAKGQCCAGKVWNEVSEKCEDCSPGRWGLNCINACRAPYYGMHCMSMCNCSENECDPALGCLANQSSTTQDMHLSSKENQAFNEISTNRMSATKSAKVLPLKNENNTSLQDSVAAFGVIFCLGLTLYIFMAIYEKFINIRRVQRMETQIREGNVHYANVDGVSVHI